MRARRAKMSRMSWVRSMTLAVERLLQIALLGGRQIVIEDHHVGRQRLRQRRQFLAPCRSRSAWPASAAGRACVTRSSTTRAGARRQFGQFVQGFFGLCGETAPGRRAATCPLDARPGLRAPVFQE